MGKLVADLLKLQARQLRAALNERGVKLGHGMCIDALAVAYGFQSWNLASALLHADTDPEPRHAGAVTNTGECRASAERLMLHLREKRSVAINSADAEMILAEALRGTEIASDENRPDRLRRSPIPHSPAT
jgi:hypothetical protein